MTGLFPPITGTRSAADYPVFSLLGANLLTILIAVLEGWDLGLTLFVYWFQSLIIGVFAVGRMLSFRTDLITQSPSFRKYSGEKGDGNPARTALAIKLFMAGFFSLHYGFFHYGYYEFLTDLGFLEGISLTDPFLLLACGGFFVHHFYSFLFHRRYTGPAGKYLQETFTWPYHRIIPMHATIIFGGFISIIAMLFSIDLSMVVLIFFLGIKTVVDVRMHIEKHREEGDEPPGE